MLQLFENRKSSAVRRSAKDLRGVGRERVLKIDGIDISVWEHQGGQAQLLFIHGNSACKETFYKQFQYFAEKGYSIAAFDLPGHGSSGNAVAPDVQYTIPGYALIAKKLMERLSKTNPLIVGWSLGGHIAIEMIGRGFDVSGALIVGTPPAGPGASELGEAFLPSEAGNVTMNENASKEELHLYTDSLYGTLDPIPKLFFDTAYRTDGRARRIMGEHWGGGEEGCHQKTVVAGASKPICVVHGLDDPFVSTDYIRSISWRTLWADKIFELRDIGHAAFLEAPERFNEILLAFAENTQSK